MTKGVTMAKLAKNIHVERFVCLSGSEMRSLAISQDPLNDMAVTEISADLVDAEGRVFSVHLNAKLLPPMTMDVEVHHIDDETGTVLPWPDDLLDSEGLPMQMTNSYGRSV
jgi:hypothetical protein